MRAAIDAFNANELDRIGEFCTEDIEIHPFEGWPDDQVYRGHSGAEKLFAIWWEFFDSMHIEIHELIERDDTVVMLCVQSGVQRGVTVEQQLGAVSRFRGDLTERIDYYLGWDKALEAAGF